MAKKKQKGKGTLANGKILGGKQGPSKGKGEGERGEKRDYEKKWSKARAPSR